MSYKESNCQLQVKICCVHVDLHFLCQIYETTYNKYETKYHNLGLLLFPSVITNKLINPQSYWL